MDNRIQQFVNQFSSSENHILLDAAAIEQIKNFEKNNDVALPAAFCEWLLFSDGGELFLPAGVQLYGVAHKPFIDVNDDDRPNTNYIVIGSLASGDPILCEKNSERISIYNHEAEVIEEDESYSDFYEFLESLEEILGVED